MLGHPDRSRSMTGRLTSGHTKQTALATRPPDVLIGWRVVIVTALTAFVLLAAGPSAYARAKLPVRHRGKPPVGLPTPPPVPAGQLDQDLSGKLPVVNINEASGDYLGEGHDQIASALDGDLKIYESAKYGGGPPKVDRPTDLRATPEDGFVVNNEYSLSPWQDVTYETVAEDWSLTRVQVAASP